MLIGQQSEVGPAIAFAPALNCLVFAWRGAGNNAVNVALASTSDNNINALGGVFTSPTEATSDTPAVSVGPTGTIYIAWKGVDNNDLSVAQLDIDTAHPGIPTVSGLSGKTSFLGLSGSFPSLYFFEHNYLSFASAAGELISFITTDTNPPNLLTVSNESTVLTPVMNDCINTVDSRGMFIGWVGTDNGELNVMLLTGGSFYWGGDQTKYTSTNTSPSAFSIAYIPDRMFLAWRGSGNNQLNVMREDQWQTNSANTLAATTDSSPAICGYKDINGINYLALAWKGFGNKDLNVEILNQDMGIVSQIDLQWNNVTKAKLPHDKIKVW